EQYSERYGEPDWDSDPRTVLAPGGESWSEFVDRAAAALAAVAVRHPGGLVVVVCHAGVIEAGMLAFIPVARTRGRLKLRTVHSSLTEFEVDAEGWRLLRYNDAAHLAQGETARSPQHA
ncbi:MAG: histidine phosphatase family protein, partial [Acidimicrobiales bacterium]